MKKLNPSWKILITLVSIILLGFMYAKGKRYNSMYEKWLFKIKSLDRTDVRKV